MRVYASLLALGAILWACKPNTEKLEESRRLVLRGRAMAADQYYAKARMAYEKALALDSLDVDAHYELGNLEAKLGRLEAAAEAYRAAIATNPDHYHARHNLAVTEADLGRLPLAVKLLKQMPNYAPALRTLPLFYFKQGHYNLAEKTLRAALEVGGDHADIREQLGQLYLRQGRYAAAQTELDRSLELDSTRVESHRLVGLSYLSQRRYEEALAAFERIIANQPFHVAAHYNMASTLIALNRQAEAERILKRLDTLAGHAAQIAHLRRQIDATPNHIETRLELARNYRQLGQTDAALTHYRAALALRPTHLKTLIQLSTLLSEQGKADEALQLCGQGIAGNADDVRTSKLYFIQGLVRLNRNQNQQARVDFEQALKLDPSSAEAWNNLANALLAVGETEEAARALKAAVQADSTLVDAHYNLGSLLLQQGQLDQARLAFLAAIAVDSTFARTYYALATVYQAQDAIPQARQSYTAFIERWRGNPNFLQLARTRLAELH